MYKFQKLKLTVLLALVALFFAFAPVFAAELTLNTEKKKIGVGDQFEVNFLLNSEDQSINAVESTVIFPKDLFDLKEIKNGNSIISFWSQTPQATGNKIHFSGVVPGGYAGRNGLVFSMVLQARAAGAGVIESSNAVALLNDGKGTSAKVKLSNLNFIVADQIVVSQISKPEVIDPDTEPPELFQPMISRDETIFDNKYFLVFAAQDKKSGIDRYEVCEGKRACVEAKSIYLLENQSLDEEITVKAIDKSGNERVVVLLPQKPKSWYSNPLNLAILVVGALFAYLILQLWRKLKKS